MRHRSRVQHRHAVAPTLKLERRGHAIDTRANDNDIVALRHSGFAPDRFEITGRAYTGRIDTL